MTLHIVNEDLLLNCNFTIVVNVKTRHSCNIMLETEVWLLSAV